MATIALYASKINNMPGLIQDVKKSVADYQSELSALKKKSLQINKSVCNLDDIISSISTSTQTQEQEITSLENLSNNIEQFTSDVNRIDMDVADVINQRKDDFYNEYNYLKPDSEKNGWEKFCDACKAVGEWCKDNWESICNITLAIITVVAIVALSIVTFGVMAVTLAAVVGLIVSVAGQLISDVISWAITGEWTGTWQSYVGAFLGGIAGGVFMLTGNFAGACAVDAAISTLIGESLEGVTGGEKRSMAEIWMDTATSAGTAAVFSKVFGKLSGKLSKSLSKKIPALRRLAGKGSYEASFKMVITKLKKGVIKHFSIKSIRNGVIGGLTGDLMKNVAYGFGFDSFISNGMKGIITQNKIISTIKPIKIPPIITIPQIHVLPIRMDSWRFL